MSTTPGSTQALDASSNEGKEIANQLQEIVKNDCYLRRVMVTLPNLEKDEILDPVVFEHPGFRRWVYQVEAAPTTGMLHAQIYIEFNTKLSFKTVVGQFKRHYNNKENAVRVFMAKGTCAQCYDYCTKGNTRVVGPFEGGLTWTSHKPWEIAYYEWEERRVTENIMEMPSMPLPLGDWEWYL